MSSLYHLIIFDWEGTLTDSLGQIVHAISKEAHALNFGKIKPEVARQYIHLGLVPTLKKVLPQLTTTQHEQLLYQVQQKLTAKSAEVHLIPGAKKFIHQLQKAHIDLAIASNKSQVSLQRALRASHLDSIFKITRSAGQTPPKPDPQMLKEIMDVFDVNAQTTLMIGDSMADMEMANNAGVTAIGMDFYHQQASSLKEAGAKKIFDNYPQLATYLGLNH
ncbi:HAD-IA family hydrolase [Legionella israelensis]|uniref:HAD family hydrolase n=1 Tax=Legionella israelensis TaxID=454 RepID=UPI00117E705E|nr:HAD-IA family hydrolase [Legionella israelensis]QDP73396.1 HAD-IA family hydrolase [Legionella israelensis]